MSDSNEKGKGEWSKREIGALWLKKSQAGNKFLSGHVETSEGEGLEENKERIMVWPNKDKKIKTLLTTEFTGPNLDNRNRIPVLKLKR